MLSQYVSGMREFFGSFALVFWNLGSPAIKLTPQDLGVRSGVTLIIVLAALLLGPRIARSVTRVPAIIETARERRLARLDAQNGADGVAHVPEVEAEEGEEPTMAEQPTGMSRWMGRVVLVCIWVFALYLIGLTWFADQAIGFDPKKLLEALQQFLVNLGFSLLVAILTLVVARALQKSIVASLRHGRVNSNLIVLGGRSIFVATLVVGFIAILSVWGLGIVLPVTLIGALTVAISLSLQDILKNVVSGIYLLLEHPFVIGDQITIAPYTGVVENIYIRVTALRTTSGERVLVPNGMLFSSAVVNRSFYQRRMTGLVVTLPDDGPAAIEAARERILSTLEDLPFALRTPAPEVALSKASGGKVDLRVVFWLPVTRTDEPGGKLSDVMEQVRTHVPEAEVAPLDAV